MRLPVVILLDLLCIALGLNVFAYIHIVRPYYNPAKTEPVPLLLSTPAPVETTPAEPEPAQEPPEQTEEVPQRVYTGPWGEKFADQLTDGEVIQTEDSYRSANVSVTLTHVKEKDLVYSIVEIYVSDIRFLRTAFGPKGYGSNGMTDEMATQNQAIAAISGDHFQARMEGPVIRNGILYRETRFQDVCILLKDGRMLTLDDSELDMDELKASEPWQLWSFGPRLLENGKAMEEFNSTVTRRNPRSAIGYVEPGHYFLVQVDGRGAFGSQGMTMRELAELFESLGCESAFNLDGGASAGMAWNGELVSYPYGRPVSDIIYVTDHPEEGEG
ncbi:MAG: phosphodiester glycosidase family protein [Clostridia bacterium]